MLEVVHAEKCAGGFESSTRARSTSSMLGVGTSIMLRTLSTLLWRVTAHWAQTEILLPQPVGMGNLLK